MSKKIHCDKCGNTICDEWPKNPTPHEVIIDRRDHYANPYNEISIDLCNCCYKELLVFFGIEVDNE